MTEEKYQIKYTSQERNVSLRGNRYRYKGKIIKWACCTCPSTFLVHSTWDRKLPATCLGTLGTLWSQNKIWYDYGERVSWHAHAVCFNFVQFVIPPRSFPHFLSLRNVLWRSVHALRRPSHVFRCKCVQTRVLSYVVKARRSILKSRWWSTWQEGNSPGG